MDRVHTLTEEEKRLMLELFEQPGHRLTHQSDGRYSSLAVKGVCKWIHTPITAPDQKATFTIEMTPRGLVWAQKLERELSAEKPSESHASALQP